MKPGAHGAPYANMSNYRRDITPGGTWFFTVVTHQRKQLLNHESVRTALRTAITTTRATHPFRIDAWVLLPDHLHCIWTLPEDDHDFSTRWSMIKRLTSKAFCDITVGCAARTGHQSASRNRRRELPFWQRRFWEHAISSEEDFDRHCDYIHFNPVRHGHAAHVAEWPFSSFFRFAADGLYPTDWGGEAATSAKAEYGEPM